MEEWEVNDMLDNLRYLERNEWERSRYAIYSNIQINSKKKLKPTDIMKFEWDDEKEESGEKQTISKEDINRLKEKSKLISKVMTNGK